MKSAVHKLSDYQRDVWKAIRDEVGDQALSEPLMEVFLKRSILNYANFQDALIGILLGRLQCKTIAVESLTETLQRAYTSSPEILEQGKADLTAFCQRDPACNRYSIPFLYYKGYHGLQLYRIGHWLWNNGGSELALYMQSQVSEVCGMDIHPAAKIGRGILIDHATSIVIGETAVVGDNVSMLHEVTLGGTGKETGDRHPKVSSGVLIGAGAKLLGPVVIGKNAKIGAGSVVLNDVDENCTVAGVPAKPVGDCSGGTPALEMDHSLEK